MSAYYYQEANGYNDSPQKQVVVGYSQVNPMDDYMLPEEEWEREAVLDPAWERQQKKVISTSSMIIIELSIIFIRLSLLGVILIYEKLEHRLRISKKTFRMV